MFEMNCLRLVILSASHYVIHGEDSGEEFSKRFFASFYYLLIDETEIDTGFSSFNSGFKFNLG